jgi:hypothetical protein
MSDADIVWSPDTLKQMATIASAANTLCTVEKVQETDFRSVALSRRSYTYRLTRQSPASVRVEIVRRYANNDTRPGCGLVMAHRQVWARLNGYCEDFVGWGWEDQDLLIRAEIAGCRVCKAGSVLHLSHADSLRNATFSNLDPSITRDANILTCVRRIKSGILRGDAGLADSCNNTTQVTAEICFESGIEAELRHTST